MRTIPVVGGIVVEMLAEDFVMNHAMAEPFTGMPLPVNGHHPAHQVNPLFYLGQNSHHNPANQHPIYAQHHPVNQPQVHTQQYFPANQPLLYTQPQPVINLVSAAAGVQSSGLIVQPPSQPAVYSIPHQPQPLTLPETVE